MPDFGYGQQYGAEQYGTEYLYAPLYIDNQVPAPGTTDVSEDAVLEFDLLEGGLPIDLATVEIYVEGALAYSGATDTFSAPYDGAASARTPITGPPAGHHLAINKSTTWLGGGQISVRVMAQDTGGTQLDQTWYVYAENQGPLITPLSPISGETDVATDSTISLQISDSNAIELSSLHVFVKVGAGSWQLAYDGGAAQAFQPGWDGPESAILGTATNRTLVLDRTGDLAPLSVISVWVFARDTTGATERL